MTTNGLLGRLERVVRQTRAAGAEAGEAFAMQDASGSLRIERNQLLGLETEQTFGIGLRTYKEGRLGFAYVTRFGQVADGIRAALKTGRLSKPLPDFQFPSAGAAPRVPGLHDRRIQSLQSRQVLEMGRDLVRAARDVGRPYVVTEAGISFGTVRVAIANTQGLARGHEETGLDASGFVVQNQEGVSTGFASQSSMRLDVDPAALGREAAELARAARHPRPLERGGRIPLVLRPDPAADLLGTLTLPSLVGKAAHQGESYYSNKQGAQVAHPKITVRDDPTMARGLGSAPFDDEGRPSRPFSPIRRGVLTTYLYDQSTAAEFRGRPTASAVRTHAFDGRSYKSPPSASGRNVAIEAPSTRTDKLVGGVDDGLLVHDLLGVHTANTVSGDFSVTSTVLFRIRKGAVEGPVAPVSVAGNFHQALRAGLTLGDDLKATSGEGAIRIPSVRLNSFTVTP